MALPPLRYHAGKIYLILSLILSLSACRAPANPPAIRIISPEGRSQVVDGERVAICMQADGATPIAGIDLLVNSLVVSSEDSPNSAGQTPMLSCQEWTARGAGTHTLLARARLSDGGVIHSGPQALIVSSQPSSPTPTPTLEPPPPTPTPLPPTFTPPPPPTGLPTPPTTIPIGATPLPTQTATPAPPTPTPLPTQPVLPVIQILSPAPGHQALAGQAVEIRGVSSDSTGVVRVELWADGGLDEFQTRATEPRLAWTTTHFWRSNVLGDHYITLRVFDSDGNWTDSDPLLIRIVANISPPRVTIVEPRGTLFAQPGQEIEIKSSATDAIGIIRLELWDGPARYTYTTSTYAGGQSPFSAVHRWQSASAGVHTLFVRAVNASELWSDSSPITVTVASGSPPSVVFNVSPRSLEEAESARVDVFATDEIGVTRVDLFVDDLLHASQASPTAAGQKDFSVSFRWDGGIAGQHTFHVVVYNAAGQRTTTERIEVLVRRQPPPPTPTPIAAVTIEISSPAVGFSLTAGAYQRVVFRLEGNLSLSRVELWSRIGDGAPELVRGEDAGGQASFSAAWDWRLTRAGLVQLWVRAYDEAGRLWSSEPISGRVETG